MGDMKWFESYENRQELAAHLITVGVLTTPRSVLRFYEKPWKYTPEWDKFQGRPTEEELGLENPDGWARVEEEDEDLRPTDLILSDGWIDP